MVKQFARYNSNQDGLITPMRYLRRGQPPDCWTRQNVKKWTDQWLAKKCEAKPWVWPQYKNKKLNKYVYQNMESWHYNKCAFCEIYLGKFEIEHFRAKTTHPFAAFVWRNLFLICPDCNKAKGTKNHEGSLKPDREDPQLFLWVNPISLKIEPKPGITPDKKQRAEKTIELYDLNRPELTRLYGAYFAQIQSKKDELLAKLIADHEGTQQISTDKLATNIRALQTYAHVEHPFSLMVKSLLEYQELL